MLARVPLAIALSLFVFSLFAIIAPAQTVTGEAGAVTGSPGQKTDTGSSVQQTQESSSDTQTVAEPSTPDASIPSTADRKLPARRDVNRIGQRHIGHGIDIYSPQKERAMGAALSTNIDQHTRLIDAPDVVEYLNRLAGKIARNSDTEFLTTVKVIDSDDINIFSLPGGFIYLDKGLITSLESEAELAGLLAHEIGHIAARHATHALTRQYALEGISLPLLYMGPFAFPLEYVALPLANRKFDRDAEFDADLLGLQYTYAAGYDPAAFVQALEKLNGLEARRRELYARIPLYKQFLKLPFHGPLSHAVSRHPDMESRMRALQKEIASILPAKDEYVVDTNEFQEAQDWLNWASRPMFHRRTEEKEDKQNRPKLRDMIPIPVPNHLSGNAIVSSAQ